MNKTLFHRGPDQQGYYQDLNCGLASSRLSIIDQNFGKQPIKSHNKENIIVYNGEVYNFSSLKKELQKKGYSFKTNTDTEVIVNLYQEYGPKIVKKIYGMFAIAIWNKKTNTLFLARDHFGIKPLHYYYKNGIFLFGSEIKAILTHPKFKKELNFNSLSQYFSTGFGCIPAPLTIFKNIKKLPPAHFLLFKNKKITIKKYWRLENIKKTKMPFDEAKQKIFSLIKKEVKCQTIADKKVFGSFLSGGIDSSTIAALANKNTPDKLNTFSIGFKEKSFDESYFAKKTAKHIGSNHHHKTFTSKQLLKVLNPLIKKIDEPFADSSLLPTYLLSCFTSKHVKVAFSGDGGDELFAGYPTYKAHQLFKIYSILPKTIRKKIIKPLVNSLPASFSNISLDFKLKRTIKGDFNPPVVRHLIWLAPFSPLEKKKLFTKQALQKISKTDPAVILFEKYFNQGKYFDQLDRLQYLDLKTYLGDFGLTKTDRASSLASLEVRPPFLNPKLAEFVFSLPSSYRLRGLTTKYILKKAVADILPQEIINRPKKGFGSPIAKWIEHELKNQIITKLDKKRLKKQEIFNAQEVQKILNQHFQHKKNNRMKIWSLFMFQNWYDNFYN